MLELSVPSVFRNEKPGFRRFKQMKSSESDIGAAKLQFSAIALIGLVLALLKFFVGRRYYFEQLRIQLYCINTKTIVLQTVFLRQCYLWRMNAVDTSVYEPLKPF